MKKKNQFLSTFLFESVFKHVKNTYPYQGKMSMLQQGNWWKTALNVRKQIAQYSTWGLSFGPQIDGGCREKAQDALMTEKSAWKIRNNHDSERWYQHYQPSNGWKPKSPNILSKINFGVRTQGVKKSWTTLLYNSCI